MTFAQLHEQRAVIVAMRATAFNRLCAEYEAWLLAEGLDKDAGCALEVLHDELAAEPRNEARITWLRDFCTRWEEETR